MTDDIKTPTESELARLDAIESRLDSIESAQRENTAATLEGNRDAREMLEIFQAVKGGAKVVGVNGGNPMVGIFSMELVG